MSMQSFDEVEQQQIFVLSLNGQEGLVVAFPREKIDTWAIREIRNVQRTIRLDCCVDVSFMGSGRVLNHELERFVTFLCQTVLPFC